MDTLIQVLVEIAKCSWEPLKKRMDYLNNFKGNAENLKSHVQELVARRNFIKKRVDERCSNGDEVTDDVQLWIERANEMILEANQIEVSVEENMKCLMGWCPNWRRRYRLSKLAKDKVDTITDHHSKGTFEIVATAPPPPRVESIPTSSIDGLKTVNLSLNKVMDALKDENIRMIGVYGMGGVGKTTLVKNVNNKLKGTSTFDAIVMVTVSKDVKLKIIQEEIAKKLGMELKEEIESTRESELRRKLMHVKKLLIILDDLWERLDIVKIGIPYSAENKWCKILLTSRSLDICRLMGSQVHIPVNLLLEDESWDLFRGKVGDVVDCQSLQDVARKAAQECRGLPLALVTLGGALSGNNNLSVWENAVTELKRSDPVYIEGMEKEVYQSLRISFSHLKTEELKQCFLFCALFPEDFEIPADRMIRYLIAEGILVKFENLEETMNKGCALIEKLKSCSLLLESEKKGNVRMHDMVRDMAIWIASKEGDYRFVVKAGLGLEDWPEMERLQECKRLSLMNNRIRKLPDRVECPQLLTLLMQENSNLAEIPDKFFKTINDLRVLDIGRTAIKRIPPSLACLQNLKELCLRDCNLSAGLSHVGELKALESLDLSRNKFSQLPMEIGNLTNLRRLDLSSNDFKELPMEIGNLTNLRRLNLSNNEILEVIPRNAVLRRLTRLEELDMNESFDRWEVEGEGVGEASNGNAMLAEVASLRRLTNLRVKIKDAHRFTQDDLFRSCTHLKKFHFHLQLGAHENEFLFATGMIKRYLSENYFIFPTGNREIIINGSAPIPMWVKLFLFPQSTTLTIGFHQSSKNLLDLDKHGFQFVVFIYMESCDEMEYLISGKDVPEYALQHVQYFGLSGLGKLEKVVSDDESLPLPTLANLTRMSIWDCHRLKHVVITPNLLQRMQNLVQLSVGSCENVEHLFVVPTENKLVLPKLQKLYLEKLPKMENMWIGLPTLQSLTQLEISWCYGSKEIFSSAQVKGLPNLAKLSVRICGEVKKIISEVEEVVGDENAMLPKLRSLELINLQKLEHFYVRLLALHSLETTEIFSCPNLKKLPFGGPDSVPSLQKIEAEREWWEELKWEEEEDSFKARLHPILY
ncbi:disease resistance protein At4g27190-like [Tasmannia lanceolata]|uniref:disease resistance protein At4g27190-like n=1 Tax=Tasmannia lanceolata TaxID=3420 RepID=UPI00406304A9